MYFDAIGLGAFAIQGAMLAVNLDMPIYAVMVAAVLTGAGGGVLRDLLAGRKPIVFQDDIYGSWAALAGLIVGLGLYQNDIALYVLLVATAGLRIWSMIYHIQLPKAKMQQ